MNKIEFARVYYTHGEWKFSFVQNGRPVEASFSEYEAAGLAKSIMSAFQKRADPDPIERAA